MKKHLIILVIINILYFSCFAQKASDVIENGIKIKSNNQVFIKYDGTSIKFQAGTVPNELNYTQRFDDSAMLLPVDASVMFYIKPVNPLNYSYKAENKIIIDPIETDAANALNSIIDNIQKISKNLKEKNETTGAKPATLEEKCNFLYVVTYFNSIVNRLRTDKKDEIIATFKSLKNLDFVKEQATIDDLDKIKSSVDGIASYFHETNRSIETLKEKVDSVTCLNDESYEFVIKQVFQLITKDLISNNSDQQKRLKNLQSSYDLVRKAQVEASKLNWLVALKEVPATKGKISIFTITINESGYKLSDSKDEIVASETKEKISKVLRIRRFQRFIPEVSVGIAHTNLSFPKYTANPDGTGKYVVADAGEEKINKLNFSTMINYNWFISNSPIHPFWQIGIGVNADFPTLLSGVGLRLNMTGARRLALAVGIATTWIKTLDKLELKGVIATPAELESDLKYKFNTKPQPYFGIQYNF